MRLTSLVSFTELESKSQNLSMMSAKYKKDAQTLNSTTWLAVGGGITVLFFLFFIWYKFLWESGDGSRWICILTFQNGTWNDELLLKIIFTVIFFFPFLSIINATIQAAIKLRPVTWLISYRFEEVISMCIKSRPRKQGCASSYRYLKIPRGEKQWPIDHTFSNSQLKMKSYVAPLVLVAAVLLAGDVQGERVE